jgi:hypothetical protein
VARLDKKFPTDPAIQELLAAHIANPHDEAKLSAMALAPRFAGQRLCAVTAPLHTLELYLDYVCPFSAKMFKTVYESVLPLVTEKNYPVQFLFRQQIQPCVYLVI